MAISKYIQYLKHQTDPRAGISAEAYMIELVLKLLSTGACAEFTHLRNLADADGDVEAVAFFDRLLTPGLDVADGVDTADEALAEVNALFPTVGSFSETEPTGPGGNAGQWIEYRANPADGDTLSVTFPNDEGTLTLTWKDSPEGEFDLQRGVTALSSFQALQAFVPADHGFPNIVFDQLGGNSEGSIRLPCLVGGIYGDKIYTETTGSWLYSGSKALEPFHLSGGLTVGTNCIVWGTASQQIVNDNYPDPSEALAVPFAGQFGKLATYVGDGEWEFTSVAAGIPIADPAGGIMMSYAIADYGYGAFTGYFTTTDSSYAAATPENWLSGVPTTIPSALDSLAAAVVAIAAAPALLDFGNFDTPHPAGYNGVMATEPSGIINARIFISATGDVGNPPLEVPANANARVLYLFVSTAGGTLELEDQTHLLLSAPWAPTVTGSMIQLAWIASLSKWVEEWRNDI